MSQERFPMDRMLSKAFLRPRETPEYEAAKRLLLRKTLLRTRYYYLRTGKWDWTAKSCGNLPMGVPVPPYWGVPWAQKVRPPMTTMERLARRVRFKGLVRDFRQIVQAIQDGEKDWVGPPAPVLILCAGQRRVAIYTDGNHRIGACAVMGSHTVPVRVVREFNWDATVAASRGRFTKEEAREWWLHAFRRIYGESDE